MAVGLVVAALAGPVGAAEAPTHRPAADPLDTARCEVREGRYRQALEVLQAAHRDALDPRQRARAAAALGQALLRMSRPVEALPHLQAALAGAWISGPERAEVMLDLANLQAARGEFGLAEAPYREALALAPARPDIGLAVGLGQLQDPAAAAVLPRLQQLARQLPAIDAAAQRVAFALRLGARAARAGAAGRALAFEMFDQARVQSLALGDQRLTAEAFDALAGLYEEAGRTDEALRLTEQGLRHAAGAQAGVLLATLEWRLGRLALAAGDEARALAALRRAVAQIETIRDDIPVDYVDGRSSFRELLGPLYLALTDLLLRQAARVPAAQTEGLLREARDAVELSKQTELADYLRDRCLVDAAQRGGPAVVPAGTAVYYPVMLADRLELLVETPAGLSRTTVGVRGEVLRRAVLAHDTALRGLAPTRVLAQQLHSWLVAPVAPLLASQRIVQVVVVPDGVLRLLPMAALHDGHDFLLQRYAFVTAAGLTLTPARGGRPAGTRALLAGLSEPGPVLGKLPPWAVQALRDPQATTGRGGNRALRTLAPGAGEAGEAALRDALALPGVRQEIAAIASTVAGTTLLDETFTRAALQAALQGREHQIVHIASHGVFGSRADASFIMTHDELLPMDQLQALLRGTAGRRPPLDLVTLSACRTAEGDDRAPLGMSGTALRARALSALGTLWPVADESADFAMTHFYRRLAGTGATKAGALREAQQALAQRDGMDHPFFWAPFVLVGDGQ